MMEPTTPINSPLGKKTIYAQTYDPSLLHPLTRQYHRQQLGFTLDLPFEGLDIWNSYELSWLNMKGKPMIAMAQFFIPCSSPKIIESKSLKLYLNSFNQTPFIDSETVKETIKKDIENAIESKIKMDLFLPSEFKRTLPATLPGSCIDDLDIAISHYQPNAFLLRRNNAIVTEMLYSHLLKSNCLVTGQPDWGSLWIHYTGPQIDPASLLSYIVSYRNQNEFAEPLVERVFVDILNQCQPTSLSVFACYTRRGGLDINPFRSNFEKSPPRYRLIRQ